MFRKVIAIRRKLELVNDLFSLVCRSATELNLLFSMPTLYLITTKLITSAISIFVFISQFQYPLKDLTLVSYYYMSYTLMDIVIIAVIFFAADLPTRKAFDPFITIFTINSLYQ